MNAVFYLKTMHTFNETKLRIDALLVKKSSVIFQFVFVMATNYWSP